MEHLIHNFFISLFPTFESRIILIIGTTLLTLLINIAARLNWQHALQRFANHPELKKELLRELAREKEERWYLRALDVACVIAISAIVWITFSQRPYVLRATPDPYTTFIDPTQSISIEFDVPVNANLLQFFISPEMEGEWVWEKNQLSMFPRKVTFYPHQSFYPGTRVLIYMVGLKSPWHLHQSHEESIEYYAPTLPEISALIPSHQTQDYAIDQPLQIVFDQLLSTHVDLQFQITPDAGEFDVQTIGNQQSIVFNHDLVQDQTYTVEVLRTPRSFWIGSNTDVKRGYTEQIAEYEFTTVATPLLTNYQPKGNAALPIEPISLVFDQAMDPTSVMQNLSIDPPIEYTPTWENPNTILITPHRELAKDTQYTVTINAGIPSIVGGKTTEDIHFSFTTVGEVAITSTTPNPGATGVDPTTSDIMLTFNQPIDPNSTLERVLINPAVNIQQAWKDNSLILDTAGKLQYSTQYTITLVAGIKSFYGFDSTQDHHYSFVTKDNTFVLDIPYYPQEHTFTCNVAATRMVLGYRGTNVSEADILSSMGTGNNPNQNWVDGYGVHIEPIANYIRQYRSVAEKKNWSTTALTAEIHQGNPVILWVYNRYSQPAGPFQLESGVTGYMGMHSEVVRGYIGPVNNPTHILTHDPWRGQLTYTRAQFETIWRYMSNTALVVY